LARKLALLETVIIVPCFNEAERLDVASFGKFATACEAVRFVMVNDGSRDETLSVLKTLEARYPSAFDVLDLGENCGKAEAVRRGVLQALATGAACFGYWDADLATPLEAILEFRRVLARHKEVDVVIGSRIPLLGHKIQRRPVRRVLGRLFAKVASGALRLPIYDTQCGAKLFRATQETASLFCEPFLARWCFDVEILARLARSRAAVGSRPLVESVYELPLESWRDVPGSKLKPRDFLVAIAELSHIYWRYSVLNTAPKTDSLPITAPIQEPADRKSTRVRRAA
jgi:glycosyltransferase involved in cell wall biosynthesis